LSTTSFDQNKEEDTVFTNPYHFLPHGNLCGQDVDYPSDLSFPFFHCINFTCHRWIFHSVVIGVDVGDSSSSDEAADSSRSSSSVLVVVIVAPVSFAADVF
jgi:hypothetical protein